MTCVCVCSLCTQQAVPGPLSQRLLSVPEAGSTLHGSGASLCRRQRPQEGESDISLLLAASCPSLERLSAGCNPCLCLQAMAIMEVAHGKSHPYVTELRQEMSSGKLKK